MGKIVNLIIAAIIIYGSGYSVKNLFFEVRKATIQKVEKGLSPSEPFAQKLTNQKLPF